MKEIDDIEDVKLWIAAHDARIDELWKTQKELNERNAEKLDRIVTRLTAVEKKVIWWTGAAAAFCSFGGAILSRFIG